VKQRDDHRLVYSSEQGRVCPNCGRPKPKCACGQPRRVDRGDGIVRVRREKKGRRGKTVTTISGIPLPSEGLTQLAGELKRRCGTGGSAKNGVIEIQGDHCETLALELVSRGYTVKRAGG
jgi:translation initiation factor 1